MANATTRTRTQKRGIGNGSQLTATREETAMRTESVLATAAAAPGMTVDDVRAEIEAQVRAAIDEAAGMVDVEVAEPLDWWDLFAVGPIQPITVNGPLLPHQVIKVGEPAFVATVLFLNPFLILQPGLSASDVLSNFALPYEVRYQTGNLTSWSLGQADMNVTHSGPGFNLVPGQSFYVDVLQFQGSTEGLYEMNVSARILGATPPFVNAPQFAGYATQVVDIDAKLFGPGPVVNSGQPVRFQIYP